MLTTAPWVDRLEAAMAVAREGQDPEGVHQVRVAIRRLVTWLDLAGQKALRSELQGLRRRVSSARDLDVLLGLDLPPALDAWLRQEGSGEQAAVRLAVTDRASVELVAALRQLPPVPRAVAEQNLRVLVRRALRRSVVLRETSPKVEAVHDLRRAVRPVRYALEWLGLSSGAIKPLQEALGDYNDAAVLLDALDRWGGLALALRTQAQSDQAAALRETVARWPAAEGRLFGLMVETARR